MAKVGVAGIRRRRSIILRKSPRYWTARQRERAKVKKQKGKKWQEAHVGTDEEIGASDRPILETTEKGTEALACRSSCKKKGGASIQLVPKYFVQTDREGIAVGGGQNLRKGD